MSNIPLATVIMPCYNCEAFIEDGIKSLLAQSYENFELIIVDDNSTDSSPSIIKKYLGERVRLIHHETNQGIARSLNACIRAAKGDFVARMDADDLSHPDRLKLQVQAFLKDDQLAVVGSNVDVVDKEGKSIYYHVNPAEDSEIRKDFASTFPIWSGSQMWRKSVLLEYGLFDERVICGEDFEQALRVVGKGKAANLQAPLYIYRKNEAGEFNVAHGSLVKRQIFCRKMFLLKQTPDIDGLESLYEEISAHYRVTRFAKGAEVPAKNKAYYYRGLAFLCRINGNVVGARANLNKAKQFDSPSLANMALAVLLAVPLPIVLCLFRINRFFKRCLYSWSAGNVSRQLQRAVLNERIPRGLSAGPVAEIRAE